RASIEASALTYKVVGASTLRGTLDGDWDLRRVLISETAKYRSMVQHFVDGLPWEETELFIDALPRRLATGLKFRGTMSLPEIAQHYRKRIDPLFLSLRR